MDVAPLLFPGDPVLPEDEARKLLARIVPLIRECVRDAFDTMRRMAAGDSDVAGAYDYLGTRQKMVNSLVVTKIRRRFSVNECGVEVRESSGFLVLRVQRRCDLRFKLVDESGRSKNQETVAQRRYRNLQRLEGIGRLDVMRLTVGWRWDVAATELEDIEIVFEKGDFAVWKFSILHDDEQLGKVVQRPAGPSDSPPAQYTSRGRKSKESKGKSSA